MLKLEWSDPSNFSNRLTVVGNGWCEPAAKFEKISCSSKVRVTVSCGGVERHHLDIGEDRAREACLKIVQRMINFGWYSKESSRKADRSTFLILEEVINRAQSK